MTPKGFNTMLGYFVAEMRQLLMCDSLPNLTFQRTTAPRGGLAIRESYWAAIGELGCWTA